VRRPKYQKPCAELNEPKFLRELWLSAVLKEGFETNAQERGGGGVVVRWRGTGPRGE